jgi:hypothetical protein
MVIQNKTLIVSYKKIEKIEGENQKSNREKMSIKNKNQHGDLGLKLVKLEEPK